MPGPAAAADRCGRHSRRRCVRRECAPRSRARRTKKDWMPSRAAHLRPARVVKKDQVDIARIIELVAAELAHAEDDEPAVALRIVRRSASVDSPLAAPPGAADGAARPRAPPRQNGSSAPVCCSSDQAPASSATAASKRDAALGDPQAPHQRRRIFAKIFGTSMAAADLGEERIGAFLDEAGQKCPLLDRDCRSETGCCRRSPQAGACREGWRSIGAPHPTAGIAFGQGQRLVPGLEAKGEPALVGRLRQPAHHRGRGEITASSRMPDPSGDTGRSEVSGQDGFATRSDAGSSMRTPMNRFVDAASRLGELADATRSAPPSRMARLLAAALILVVAVRPVAPDARSDRARSADALCRRKLSTGPATGSSIAISGVRFGIDRDKHRARSVARRRSPVASGRRAGRSLFRRCRRVSA